MSSPDVRWPLWKLALLFLGWGVFCAFLVSGFPPAVDMPAHGAQMQTLAELLRGNPQVASYFRPAFPIGYGLPHWLFLPVTWLFHGAFAVRAATWTALMLFPVAHLWLCRLFSRPDWTVLLGLPLAFNVSYWYGFLPSLFALPLAMLALAAYLQALRGSPGRNLLLFSLFSTLTVLSHLIPFAALGVAVAVAALAWESRWRNVGWAAVGFLIPGLLCAGRVFTLVGRAVAPHDVIPTSYEFGSHLNWLFKNFRVEGYLSVAGPLLICAVFVLGFWVHRRQEPKLPALLFLSLFLLFVATPKNLSGAWLVHVRLLSLVGFAALLMVNGARLRLPIRAGLFLIVVVSLAETTLFHVRFKQHLSGLEELVQQTPPAGPHGFVAPKGRRALGSRLPYLEHLGGWWTATRGGVGHHFFADIDHQSVRFQPGVSVPGDLTEAEAEELRPFEALMVLGERPLPAPFVSSRAVGRWQLWVQAR